MTDSGTSIQSMYLSEQSVYCAGLQSVSGAGEGTLKHRAIFTVSCLPISIIVATREEKTSGLTDLLLCERECTYIDNVTALNY